MPAALKHPKPPKLLRSARHPARPQRLPKPDGLKVAVYCLRHPHVPIYPGGICPVCLGAHLNLMLRLKRTVAKAEEARARSARTRCRP